MAANNDSTKAASYWCLEKYARCNNTKQQTEQSKQTEDWQLTEASAGSNDLKLVLTSSHHLIVSHGQVIKESLSLWNSQQWMRGVSKGDSLLLVIKYKGENRKFRVKFRGTGSDSGSRACVDCVSRLHQYCPVKCMDGPAVSQSADGDTRREVQKLTGLTPVGQLAQVLRGDLAARLPLAYTSSPPPTAAALPTLLRLCLTDPAFPALVGAVDAQLDVLARQDSS